MNKLASLFLIVAVAVGAFAIHQYREVEHLRALVIQMKKDAAGAREESDNQTAEVRTLKERTRTQKVAIEQLEARNKELSNGPAPEAAPATAAEPGKEEAGGFMKGMAKMFTDPKMKEMMKAQQAAGVTMMYGDLARELGLTADEARLVLGVLSSRQTELMSKNMAAMSKSGLDTKTLAAAGKEGEAVKASYDGELKSILGEERFGKFQEYEKSIGERFALDQIRNQLSAGGTPLQPEQSTGLLAIMKEERARTPNSMSAFNANPAAQAKLLESDAAMEVWMKSQEAYNARVLDRARGLLSPDQVVTFEAAQKQQIEMQRMGARMSKEMFKQK